MSVTTRRKLVKLLMLIETIGTECEADLRKRKGTRLGLMVQAAREARQMVKS